MNDDYSWLKSIPQNIGNYIAGFVDGEGSFNVSLRKREDHSLGWQVILTLNAAHRDKTVLALMKQHLGCGRLQERKDGVHYFVVQNPVAIEERIIPFFEKYSFLSSSKKKNFSIFSQIAKMVFKKDNSVRIYANAVHSSRDLIKRLTCHNLRSTHPIIRNQHLKTKFQNGYFKKGAVLTCRMDMQKPMPGIRCFGSPE